MRAQRLELGDVGPALPVFGFVELVDARAQLVARRLPARLLRRGVAAERAERVEGLLRALERVGAALGIVDGDGVERVGQLRQPLEVGLLVGFALWRALRLFRRRGAGARRRARPRARHDASPLLRRRWASASTTGCDGAGVAIGATVGVGSTSCAATFSFTAAGFFAVVARLAKKRSQARSKRRRISSSMAPEWARANRPLVIIITGINIVVTLVFRADVEAQGGAYATGVLVLMSSAALAVAISAWRRVARWVPFFAIAAVFFYTTVTNMVERPEGIKIASLFILGIVISSLVSRTLRSTELRVHGFVLDETATTVHRGSRPRASRSGSSPIVPAMDRSAEYEDKVREARNSHHLTMDDSVLFLEVRPGDASQFTEVLKVEGVQVGPYRVLRCQSPAIPNAIAALLLHIRDRTGQLPHVYFGWTEGNPITYVLKFLAFGEGDTAPVTREVLRKSEPDPLRRPRVHVG